MGIVRCFKWGELITGFSLKGRWVYLQSFRSLSSNLLSAYQLDVGLPSREVKKTYPTARDASETCVNSDILWGYEEGTLVTWTLSWIKTTQKFQKFQKRRSSGKDFWKRKQNPKQIWDFHQHHGHKIHYLPRSNVGDSVVKSTEHPHLCVRQVLTEKGSKRVRMSSIPSYILPN